MDFLRKPCYQWPSMSTKAQKISYALGRSVRSYRQLLDDVARACVAGKLPWDAYAKAAAGTKVSVEMLLSERTLASMGGDHEADVSDPAILRDDVGPLVEHRRVKVTARTGVDKHGAVVDDKTVAIEGNALDADSIEGEAEAATLA